MTTFDPLIPSNGDWPGECVPVFVSLRDTFHLVGLHMRTLQGRVGRACKEVALNMISRIRNHEIYIALSRKEAIKLKPYLFASRTL